MDSIDAETLALEVADSNFGDERLTKRLRTIVAALAAEPGESLTERFDSAGLEAAYRFFANHRITPQEILTPHVEATRGRCAGDADILVVHDTTMFSFRWDGEREGLGRVQRSNVKSSQALYAHVSLAIAADGTRRPLGVAALHHWTRNDAVKGKEHLRWEAQARESSSNLDALATAVHIMDREADDFQMFHALSSNGHRFIVRCVTDRRLETSSGDIKLRELFGSVSATIEQEIQLVRRKEHRVAILRKIHPARSARTARLSVAGATVALKRPETKSHRQLPLPPSLQLNVVRVWEEHPPEGETGVEWYLYTTDPIDTAEQQLTIVDRYRARWVIEEYFKALKTGCDFESRQLGDYEGLVNLLATFTPIAYRMLLIRSEARRAPDESALSVLTEDHITVLRAKGRSKLTASPTTREIYRAVAILGGHIKYSKRDPGWLTLARGLEKLETLTEGYLIAKLQHSRDQP